MEHSINARLNRRGFCLCCLGAATVGAARGWLTPREAFAQAQGIVQSMIDAAGTAPIRVQPLRGGLSFLEGSGGNIAVSVGPDGKVMVDSGLAGSRAQMTRALSNLGPQPVTQVINTHWHFDHANGNEWLHETGPAILSHGNTQRHLSTLTRVEDWDYDFQPLASEAVPSVAMGNAHTLRLNGTVELTHYPDAHTDGDIIAHFVDQDIVHTGDIYWSAGYPFIDHSTGGTIGGTITAVSAILGKIGDDTIVIPGHGPVSTKAQLADYNGMLIAISERVSALKSAGRTEPEIIEAAPTAPFDDRWGHFLIDPAFFVRLVYADL